MLIFYGIDDNKINVTDICLNQLNRDNIITIPANDFCRAGIFGDPVQYVEKKFM
jgi:hypothetical protein